MDLKPSGDLCNSTNKFWKKLSIFKRNHRNIIDITFKIPTCCTAVAVAVTTKWSRTQFYRQDKRVLPPPLQCVEVAFTRRVLSNFAGWACAVCTIDTACRHVAYNIWLYYMIMSNDYYQYYNTLYFLYESCVFLVEILMTI